MSECKDERHDNWLNVAWGLLYVQEGLQNFVESNGQSQYKTFMNTVNQACTNQTCNTCQVNRNCPNGTTKLTGKSKFRPGHFCDLMKLEIENNHVRNTAILANTDSTKWSDPQVGNWEVAKCYLSSPGYLDKTGPNQVDATGLLSMCINSSYMRQHVTSIGHFEEVMLSYTLIFFPTY